MRRRQELSKSILSHTCQDYYGPFTYKKVRLGVKLIEVQVGVGLGKLTRTLSYMLALSVLTLL